MKTSKPTSFDIAYKAGVSQSTVSRALRDSPLVNLETRKKIQQIARELNYKIDKNARNLRSQSTGTIALLLCEDPGDSSLINPFFLSLLGSITRACARNEYDLLVSFQQLSEDWHADYEDANRADGIIFLGYGDYLTYEQKAQKLIEENAHFITWGPVTENQVGHSIGCDNFQGGYNAAQHLIKCGHRRIAFIGDRSEHCPEFKQRYEGFLKALKESGIEPDERLLVDADVSSETAGEKAVLQLQQQCEAMPIESIGKERPQAFDALFCASDLMAIGAMRALQRQNLTIPNDVAIIGFDDILGSSYTSPALTTMQQNTELAGELLVDNLLCLIRGETIESFLVPADLIVRESCGA